MISMWPLCTGSNEPGHTARCIVVNVVENRLNCYIQPPLQTKYSVTGSTHEIHSGFAVSPSIHHVGVLGPDRFSCFLWTFQDEEAVVHEDLEGLGDHRQQFVFVDIVGWVGDHQIPACRVGQL